ncbi:MAG: RNA 2',3'-cyclic phosphodiesterase [Actinobacteria bacterium]|nr:RNA 2',3'-cyclic phosphodiesterase [Actinomycetota bacterium]
MARDRASRPEARPLRLFVAADVPPGVVEQLKAAIGPLREKLGTGRWPPPGNWHVTLKFLGGVYPRLAGWVQDTVREVAAAHPAFRTSLGGLGAFPNPRRARVLWAGLDDPSPGFATLAAGLDEALSGEFRPEKRPLTPHLTVARFQPPVALPDLPEDDVWSEGFPVEGVVLYRSHLQRPAPRYEPLATFPLEG